MKKPQAHIRYALGAALDALLPRLCPVCRSTLGRGETLMCACCLAMAPRTLMHRRRDNSVAARVSRPGLEPALAAAWLEYRRDSPYASVVRDAKFRHMPAMAREAGRIYGLELMADGVPQLADIDVLLPVPLHWRRLLQRGYNQSREAAEGLADATGIDVGDNLVATRAHRTQTRQSAEARRRNVSGIIAVRHPDELRGLHVAVVDDVVTTGSTLSDALRAVQACGPRAMSVLALGAVPADAFHFAPECGQQ
ncbi:MAG: ComF family protein [Muribaculaceae bacterium]|nr:ComF family protein [Muribaculaceae bacterium]MDE6541525.1 ComF family protein [Muribaculaceae bacterium]